MPKSNHGEDYLGAFAVTSGIGLPALVAKAEADLDDYQAILLKAVADRLAEASAEWLHAEVRRKHWGYASDESLSNQEIIKEKYQGIRPAPGYPACPNHGLKPDLFQLLGGQKRVGIQLTENYAMDPPASVCGFYFAHSEAHYFGVGQAD